MAVQATPMFLQNATGHPAEDVRRMLWSMMGGRPGIIKTGDLAVTQNGTPNMSVNVADGRAFIAGTEGSFQGVYHLENRGTLNVVIAASDPTNPRRDLIVAKVQDAIYSGSTNAASIVAVTGTPNASPVDPAVPNNCIVLARVAVAANATSIVNANITDLRTSFVQSSSAVLQQTYACGLSGVLVCTSTTRPTLNLSNGMVIFETDTKNVYIYNGLSWDLFNSVPGAWTAPTLLNSWVNVGAPQQVAQYRKVGDMVQLRGSVKNGTATSGTTIYTLPTGFRPPTQHIFVTLDGANAAGRFDVDTSGNVLIQVGSNAQFTLIGQFSTSS